MSKTIKITIADEYVIGSGVSIGAVGSHDETVLEMHFSELWNDTTKRVFWKNALGEDAAVTIVTPIMDVDGKGNVYQVPVAPEAKTYAGEAGVTIKGVKIDAETGVETEAVVTETAYFRVLQAYCGVPETADVTPSQAEQLQAEIDEIKDSIHEVIVAEEAKAAAAAAKAAAIEAEENKESSAENADIAANSANSAKDAAENAATSASKAAASETNVKLSKSWAVGGTGTREDEDKNNAKFWAEQASNAAVAGVNSFNGRSGIVFPKPEDYTPEFIGAMDKSVYDADGDGVVDKADNAQKLEGFKSNHFAIKGETDHTADGLLTTTALKNGIAKLGVVGKSYKSKNLLENTASTQTASGLTFTVNDNKSVTVNGVATQNHGLFIPVTLRAGKYILTGCPAGGSDYSYRLDVRRADNTGAILWEDVGNGVTFDVAETTDYIIAIRFASGYTANNLVFKPMLTLAEDTGADYEPFGITSVGEDGTTELMVAGKNLLPQPDYSTEGYGLKWECNNGLWHVYGTTTGLYPRAYLAMPVTLYAGRYTSTPVFVKGTNNDVSGVRICNTALSQYIQQSTGTVTDTTEFTTLIFGNVPVGTAIDVEFYLMIELGSVSTEYEPYKNKQDLTIPITLNGIPVDEGGNYTDENGQMWLADKAEIQNGVVTVVRNVGVYTISENSSFAYSSSVSADNSAYIQVTDIDSLSDKSVPYMLCDKLQVYAERDTLWLDQTISGIAYETVHEGRLRVRLTDCLDEYSVDGVKDWLADNRTKVIYPLVTPTTETYSVETISNQAGTVNIIQPDGAGLIATLSGAASSTAVETAQTAADNAQTAADNAQTAADNAQQTADNAIPKGAVTAILLVDELPENPDPTILYLIP